MSNKKKQIITGIGIAILFISVFSFYAILRNREEPENIPDQPEQQTEQSLQNVSGDTEIDSQAQLTSPPATEKSYALPDEVVAAPEWDETEQDYTALQEGFYLEGFPEEMLSFVGGDVSGLQDGIQTVLYNNGYYDYHSATFGQNITFDYTDQEILFPMIAHANVDVNLAVTYRRDGGTWHIEPY